MASRQEREMPEATNDEIDGDALALDALAEALADAARRVLEVSASPLECVTVAYGPGWEGLAALAAATATGGGINEAARLLVERVGAGNAPFRAMASSAAAAAATGGGEEGRFAYEATVYLDPKTGMARASGHTRTWSHPEPGAREVFYVDGPPPGIASSSEVL